MKNISLALIISLPLFVGCGSSSNTDTKDNTIKIYPGDEYSNYKDRPDIPTQNQSYIPTPSQETTKKIKDAGYQHVSNIFSLDSSKIAFTSKTDDGDRFFCIYNTFSEKEINRIEDFNGNKIKKVINNNIYFDNNILVNIENLDQLQTETYVDVTTGTKTDSKNSEEIIKSLYTSNFVSFTYTYKKQGAFVEIKRGNIIELHLFGLKSDKTDPIDEKILKTYSSPMVNIIAIEGGLVKLVDNAGESKVYDYIKDEDLDVQTQTTDNPSLNNAINSRLKKYYEEKQSNWKFHKLFKLSKISDGRYLAKCDVSVADDFETFVILDTTNVKDIKAHEIREANLFTGSKLKLININTDDKTITYRFIMNSTGYSEVLYNYIELKELKVDDVVYDDNHKDNSPIKDKISKQVENYVMMKNSLKGGGILAVGSKGENYSFYRFDANKIKLEEAYHDTGLNKSIIINSIEALPKGIFKLSTSDGDYTFDYFNGALSKQ